MARVIETVEGEIEEVKAEIKETKSSALQIKTALSEVETQLRSPCLSEEAKAFQLRKEQQLRTELQHLQTKEQQLRTELQQLRTELQQLRTELQQLRAKEERTELQPLRAKEEEQLRTELQRLRVTEEQLLAKLNGRLDKRASTMMTHLCNMKGRLPAPGEVLSFGASGLLLDPKFSCVYIRACYKPLFEVLRTSNVKDIIVTGTPGIGKSMFLYYLLARLVELPEPPPYILWEHSTVPDEMRCYDHASGEVRSGNRGSFTDQLEKPKAWYISDGIAPNLTSLARIILITSPSRFIYKAMEKSGARSLYMPLWSLEELLDCRAKMYDGSVPKDLAVRLYEHYGGVARYVLGVPSLTQGSAQLHQLLQPLTTALDASSTAQVKSGIGGLETGPEASHRVLHIVAKDDFTLSHLDFASPWVADAVVAKAMNDDLTGLASLVAGTKGAIRGHVYEQLMHRLLAQGGTFTVVPIYRNTLGRAEAVEELQLPHCTSWSFKNVAEISAANFPEHAYYRPVQANFPTVDSLLRMGKTLCLFQMTVDSSKTLSESALARLFGSLGTKVEELDLCLYYVVHPDVFESFKLRPDNESSRPGKWQPHAARTRVYILEGDAEVPLQQQQTGVSRKRPATTAAAATTGSHGGGGGGC